MPEVPTLHRVRDEAGGVQGPRDVHSAWSVLSSFRAHRRELTWNDAGSMTEVQNQLPPDAFGDEFADEPPVEKEPAPVPGSAVDVEGGQWNP